MSSEFLDKTGLDTLWAKIKSTFQTLGNLVTDWGSTPSDTKYPSEKLVKTSLDAKATKIEFTQPAEYKSFVIIEDVTRWYDPTGTAGISKGYQLIGQIAYWRSGGGYESMAVAFIKFHLNYRWQLTNDSCCEVKSTLPNNSFCPMIIKDARDENNVKYYFGLRVKIAWNSTVQFIGRTRDLSFSNLAWIPGENAAHTGNGTEFPVGITIERNCDLLEWNSIANGGTGATTARGAMYNTIGQEPTLDSTLDGDRLVPIRNNEVSATDGVFRWFKLSNVWNYIKGQISSVLGLSESNGVKTFTGTSTTATNVSTNGAASNSTARHIWFSDSATETKRVHDDNFKYTPSTNTVTTNISGNAATATTAAGYTSGGAIDTALQGKQADLGIDSSSGDTSKFLNEKGQWAKPDNDCIVMIQTTATSTEVDDILNDGKLPVLVVGSGSTSNYYQFMKVTSGAYIFGRVFEDYIYTYTLAAGTWTLSSVQLASYSHVHGNLGNDGKSTSEPTSTTKFLRADGSWQVPPKSLQYWSGGSTNIKGVYIGTCNLQNGSVGWITGTMSVTNYYSSNPITPSGKGIAIGNFHLWAYRNGATITASCRLYSLNARHTNTDLMLVYKKDTSDATTYKVRFYVCFGPGVTGGGTATEQRPFGLGVNYLENHNADIPESLTGITDNIQYDDDYYSILKMPYLAQGAAGVGSAARPVYVNSSGQVTACNDAKFYSSGWNEIDYNYRSHFVISSSQNGRGFTINVTKLAENVSYELGAVLVDSGYLRFQLKFKKTSSNYYLYGCRNNGTNLVSADVETTNRPEDNVRVVRIGTNVYVIGY